MFKKIMLKFKYLFLKKKMVFSVKKYEKKAKNNVSSFGDGEDFFLFLVLNFAFIVFMGVVWIVGFLFWPFLPSDKIPFTLAVFYKTSMLILYSMGVLAFLKFKISEYCFNDRVEFSICSLYDVIAFDKEYSKDKDNQIDNIIKDFNYKRNCVSYIINRKIDESNSTISNENCKFTYLKEKIEKNILNNKDFDMLENYFLVRSKKQMCIIDYMCLLKNLNNTKDKIESIDFEVDKISKDSPAYHKKLESLEKEKGVLKNRIVEIKGNQVNIQHVIDNLILKEMDIEDIVNGDGYSVVDKDDVDAVYASLMQNIEDGNKIIEKVDNRNQAISEVEKLSAWSK